MRDGLRAGVITMWGFIGNPEAQSAGGRNCGNATGHRKMAVKFVGCNHVQVTTLPQNGAGKQEVLNVSLHDCGDAACKVLSKGHFERFLKNIENMDKTVAVVSDEVVCDSFSTAKDARTTAQQDIVREIFWVNHKQTITRWALVRTRPAEKN